MQTNAVPNLPPAAVIVFYFLGAIACASETSTNQETRSTTKQSTNGVRIFECEVADYPFTPQPNGARITLTEQQNVEQQRMELLDVLDAPTPSHPSSNNPHKTFTIHIATITQNAELTYFSAPMQQDPSSQVERYQSDSDDHAVRRADGTMIAANWGSLAPEHRRVASLLANNDNSEFTLFAANDGYDPRSPVLISLTSCADKNTR